MTMVSNSSSRSSLRQAYSPSCRIGSSLPSLTAMAERSGLGSLTLTSIFCHRDRCAHGGIDVARRVDQIEDIVPAGCSKSAISTAGWASVAIWRCAIRAGRGSPPGSIFSWAGQALACRRAGRCSRGRRPTCPGRRRTGSAPGSVGLDSCPGSRTRAGRTSPAGPPSRAWSRPSFREQYR